MSKRPKLIIGISITLIAVIATLFSSTYSDKFIVPITVTTQGNDYVVNSPSGEINNLNYFVSKGKLSTFSFNRAPYNSPGSLCTGTYITPNSADVTSRGWPLRYAYGVYPLWCANGDYYTYLPLAFLLNVIIFAIVVFAVVILAIRVIPKKIKTK
jgi:hypothetical protein